MRFLLILALAAGAARPARALQKGAKPAAPLPGLSRPEFQALLQGFVDHAYQKSFRHLGDERDFDHGHILFDSASKLPRAILYHTQETGGEHPPGSEFGYIDPEGRNWIQWIAGGKIEKADAYERKEYPRSAFWSWFVELKLPALRKYRTIIDKMLDPALVGADTQESLQWVFTRVDCAEKSSAAAPMDIRLPDGQSVCLDLSA